MPGAANLTLEIGFKNGSRECNEVKRPDYFALAPSPHPILSLRSVPGCRDDFSRKNAVFFHIGLTLSGYSFRIAIGKVAEWKMVGF